MSHFTKPILAAAFSMLFALTSHASSQSSLRGFIQRNGDIYVQTDDQRMVKVTGANTQVQADLYNLKSGDYLVARGTVTGSTASIDSIESLGLQALVGSWTTENLEVYEFRDFTRLNLYLPDQTSDEIVKAGEFNYSLAPDSGSRYQLFLSSSQTVTVGSLEFRKNHLVLTVIDPATGISSPDIVLSPLARSPDSE